MNRLPVLLALLFAAAMCQAQEAQVQVAVRPDRVAARARGERGQVSPSAATVLPPEASAGGLATRWFTVLPTMTERMRLMERDMSHDDRSGDFKPFFTDMGVDWPDGSSVTYLGELGKLAVRNTPDNLARVERMLGVMGVTPRQVQIDLQFVAFDLTNVAHLAVSGINVASLTALWTNGCGEVTAAPTVVTKSGQEAVVKGVTEVIYPTTFDACEKQESSSNGLAIVTGAVVTPCGFQTRETGCLLQVVPEIGQDGMINLTLNPQVVEDPIWEDFSQTVPDASGKEQRIQMRQPFFHVLSTSTSVSVYSGKRTLLGGGMPMTDQKRVVYVFVTATLVDPEGQPIKTEAAP